MKILLELRKYSVIRKFWENFQSIFKIFHFRRNEENCIISNRNVCSGALFGQPCENRRYELTVNFKKLRGPVSISAKTIVLKIVTS